MCMPINSYVCCYAFVVMTTSINLIQFVSDGTLPHGNYSYRYNYTELLTFAKNNILVQVCAVAFVR